ncbi:MAG: hypothetical protein R3Y67_10220 [Eubacteriales bacterium]
MLNEEKIKLMTKMSSYEQQKGKKNLAIGNYFKSDYMTWQMVKTFVSATIAFALCLGLYALYDFEVLIQDIYKMDLIAYAKDLLLRYAIFTGVYMLISYIFHMIQYQKVRYSLKSYYACLNELIKIYKKERLERRR